MEAKKSPKADLEKKKSVFLQIGLIVSLGLAILAFQWKTFDKVDYNLGQLKMDDVPEEIIPLTERELKPPPPPPPPAIEIKIVDDKVEVKEDPKIMETEATQETKIVVVEQRKEEPTEAEIFTIVERMPSFRGCEGLATEDQRTSCTYNKIQEYLGKTVVYPNMAKDNGITGTVYVTFVIGSAGEVKDAKILRGIGGGCDEEALRAVRGMPKWGAGQQRGKSVSVQYNLPVRFTLK